MPKKKPKNKIPLIPAFHIFCEGGKTEPYYIRGYIDNYHSENKNLLLVEDTKKNTPVQLVEVAIDHKKTTTKDDIYWVVFDRESTVKYSNELHLKARNLANKNNIEIAFSNVCFELWLLLHMDYSAASYDCCDDLLKNSKLKSLLRDRGINDYDKGFALLFDTLKNEDGVSNAMRNSDKLRKFVLAGAEQGKEQPHQINPYIDVQDMFTDMDNFINGEPSIRKVG